ncbi:RNA-binding domain-containing protein [Candidatus Pyrohabitans sp.]
MRISIRAEVFPTESVEKVRKAVENLFPGLTYEVVEEGDRRYLLASGEGRDHLQRFHTRLRELRILDAARSVMLGSLRKGRVSFRLNKQAAFAGYVNFSEEAPLGAIEVEIEDEGIGDVVDWLAPSTVEGREP